MAENEQKKQQEQAQAEAKKPSSEQPEGEEAAEVPAADQAAEVPAADQASEESSGAEAPAQAPGDEPPVGEAAAEPPKAGGDEGEGPPKPKQLRKLARSRFSGPALPPRSPAERAKERVEDRTRHATERSRWRRGRRERDRATPPAPTPAAPAPAAPDQPVKGRQSVRQGIVVSSKADKTITVRIDLVSSHPVYGKVMRETSRLHAHDERNEANEGDVVRVMECRPLSRMKRWRLLDVVEKAR